MLAETLGAMVVQRHPAGIVRVVARSGVFRWDGRVWQHQPLVSAWVDTVGACAKFGDRDVLETLLEFAVHDLGARGIGATLVYRPDARLASSFDERLAAPPPLRVMRPADLAPLRHILSQTDGAALFDDTGVLTQIGVRLVPSARAELEVSGLRGTRHTSARRYSFDDPSATVIVVSEDGPVTVLRHGDILGASVPADRQRPNRRGQQTGGSCWRHRWGPGVVHDFSTVPPSPRLHGSSGSTGCARPARDPLTRSSGHEDPVQHAPAYGHVYPLLPLALAAPDAGHDVAFATTGPFLADLAALGFEVHDVGISIEAARDALLRDLADLAADGMPTDVDGRPDLDIGGRLFLEIVAPATVAGVTPLLPAVAPDVVVYEQYELGAGVAATRPASRRCAMRCRPCSRRRRSARSSAAAA